MKLRFKVSELDGTLDQVTFKRVDSVIKCFIQLCQHIRSQTVVPLFNTALASDEVLFSLIEVKDGRCSRSSVFQCDFQIFCMPALTRCCELVGIEFRWHVLVVADFW